MAYISWNIIIFNENKLINESGRIDYNESLY